MLAAFHRVIAKRRVALVVEIVQQRDDAPRVFVLAEGARVAAHRGLDRQGVLQETLALRVFVQELPGVGTV